MEAVVQQFPVGQGHKSLVSKLIAAILEIQLIPKKGHNQFSNYSYATCEDIVQAVRGPLARHGLLVFSSLKERISETVTTTQGKPAFREKVTLTVVVTDGESQLTLDVPGEGQDTGDKAIYKALTGAGKYALRSLLQLPIGDDPEADTQEILRQQHALKPLQQAPSKAGAQPAPPLVMTPPQRPSPVPSNGLATERQVAAIKALAKALEIDDTQLESGLKSAYNVERPEALTRKQASEALTWLKNEQTRRQASPPVAQ